MSVDGILEMYAETGSPWSIINIVIAMALPHWGYRIVVFFLFLLAGLFFYSILKRLDFLAVYMYPQR